MKIKSNRIHKRRKRITRRAKRNNALRTKNNRKYVQMNGGLGPHDGVNIGINDKMVFVNPNMIPIFKEMIFGSNERAKLWEDFFTLCREKGITLYILTSGIKLGIIRTLQLLNMDNKFKEVLCIRKDDRDRRDHKERMKMSEFIVSNPPNSTHEHNFGFEESYTTKFEVIRTIMSEEGISCSKSNPDSKCEAIFIDDQFKLNSRGCESCENVEVIDAAHANDSEEYNLDIAAFHDLIRREHQNYLLYVFFHCNMITLRILGLVNFIPKSRIKYMTTRVEEGSCKIIFFDWDGTISALPGALPLHKPIYLNNLTIFEDIHSLTTPLLRIEDVGGTVKSK